MASNPPVTREQLVAAWNALVLHDRASSEDARYQAGTRSTSERIGVALVAAHAKLEARAEAHKAACERALREATAVRCAAEDVLRAAVATGDALTINKVSRAHNDFNYQVERDAARAFADACFVLDGGLSDAK